MKQKYRAVFISDIHLGSPASQADLLLKFLSQIEAEQIFLVGDIIDLWSLKRTWFWPNNHNEVIRKFFSLASQNTKVVYVVGNHDELLRFLIGYQFGSIEITDQSVYETVLGKKMLVIHGDAFDNIVKYHKRIAHLGSHAYDYLITVNRWFNSARRFLGMPYWSLSGFLKRQVKEAGDFIHNFEVSVTNEATRLGYDGVVCGHIHKADIKEVNNSLYTNIGDGVDTCSSLVETLDGQLKHIYWSDL